MSRVRSSRLGRLPRPRSAEAWCDLAVVLGALVFVFSQIHPDLIVSNTTPTGGDTGAHVFAPAYLRDHLLPSGRLFGWAPGWYAGFPLYVFYPVPPALAIVALNVVMPYGVAFKLVTLAGTLLLPIAAYVMARLSGLRFPTPAVAAAATLPFLFDKSFSIYGGNLESTFAGEFSFSLALAFGLITFGLLSRALRTGQGRALTAFFFALAVLCHPIVAFYTAVGVVTLTLVHLTRRRFVHAALIAVVAGLLAAWWVLPFLGRRSFMSTMGFYKLPVAGQNSGDYLAPPHLRWVLAVAAIGLIASVVQRNRLGLALGANALIFAILFPNWPDVGLWNARLLPFYFLCVYLLAGLGAVALGRLVAAGFRRIDPEVARYSILGTAPAVLAFTVVLVGLPLHAMPGGSVHGNSYSWLGISTTETSVVPAWSKQNYGGYEKAAGWDEYHAVMQTMTTVGGQHGCGRAEWEYDQSLGRYGTPDAMMLLPYWTKGCIDSMEGLYYESSSTTPYHFLTAAEQSAHPSDPMAGLPYGSLDLVNAVEHMQLLGVRYYMAFSPEALTQAKTVHALHEVATSGPWHIFEIANTSVVSAMTNQPAVMQSAKHWQKQSVKWFVNYADDPKEPVLTAAGPKSWQRVASGQQPTATPLPTVAVTNVRTGNFDVRFDVSQVGVPVLVKVSAFPNWQVSGAKGPYRATPNFMVVIPTSTHVHLHYAETPLEMFAWFLTALGILGLVLLARAGIATVGNPLPGETDPIIGLHFTRPRSAGGGGAHRLGASPESDAQPDETHEGAGHPA